MNSYSPLTSHQRALRLAWEVFGVLDVEVIEYTDDNWLRIYDFLGWEWSVIDPLTEQPEVLYLDVAYGNLNLAFNKGDYLVKDKRKPIIIGRLSAELVQRYEASFK